MSSDRPLPVLYEDEDGRRIYKPRDWRKQFGGPGYPPGLEPPTPHRACTQCGGYLQGTREIVGICLNCSDGRGWVVHQVEKEPRYRK